VVQPYDVPAYVLRVPVRYYRDPPPYFRGWRADRAPRWGERWGREWEGRRAGWDQWDRRAVPRPAPLPAYQRSYVGERYPRDVEQQRSIHTTRYVYQPRETVTQQHYGNPGWHGEREHERHDAGERPAPGNLPPGHRPHGEGHDRGNERGEGHGEGHR
jgi:hypothetical protein